MINDLRYFLWEGDIPTISILIHVICNETFSGHTDKMKSLDNNWWHYGLNILVVTGVAFGKLRILQNRQVHQSNLFHEKAFKNCLQNKRILQMNTEMHLKIEWTGKKRSKDIVICN